MNRRFLPLLIFLLLVTACSVQIYDLQPIIIGTNTPTPTTVSQQAYVAVTPSPYVRSATATPPIHIAPTEITSSVAVNITEIAMIDGGTGWSIGRITGGRDKLVMRTTDGANTWKNVTPSQVIYDNAGETVEVSGCFRDADHAWLIFHDPQSFNAQNGIRVWRTEDGGQTWEAVSLPTSGYTIQNFTDPKISFLDANTGWIFVHLGHNETREFIGLYTTYDGGRNWSAMVTSNSGNMTAPGTKNGVVFRDTLEGWITGANTAEEPDAVLWHTFDGGNSWYQQYFPAPFGIGIPEGLLSDPSYQCSLSVPKFVDVQYQYAWAVLSCTSSSLNEPISVLYWTYDRLSSWRTTLLPSASGDLSFYGTEYGWYAVTNAPGSDFPYEILFSEDSGTNWRIASELAWDSRLQFITPAIGYGIATYNGQLALVKTSNSGFSWEQIFPMVGP